MPTEQITCFLHPYAEFLVQSVAGPGHFQQRESFLLPYLEGASGKFKGEVLNI